MIALWKRLKWVGALAIALCLFGGVSGCTAYDTPEVVEVGPSETAFVIPLSGDTTQQQKFESSDFLKQYKVATKRILVTHTWLQTGHRSWEGHWIPAQRVIKVDRAPVTREWTEATGTGTTNRNEAIQSETSDSIAFTARMNCTAEVQELDTAQFLYKYSGRQLSDIIDLEIRNRIQSVFTEESAKVALRNLTPSKSRVMEKVRKLVIPYFKGFGITITNLGIQGEFTYNEKVQDAINEVFLAAQRLRAQTDENLRLQMATRALTNPKAKEAQRLAWAHEERMALIKAFAEGKAQFPSVMGGGSNVLMQMMPQTSAQAEQPEK